MRISDWGADVCSSDLLVYTEDVRGSNPLPPTNLRNAQPIWRQFGDKSQGCQMPVSCGLGRSDGGNCQERQVVLGRPVGGPIASFSSARLSRPIRDARWRLGACSGRHEAEMR